MVGKAAEVKPWDVSGRKFVKFPTSCRVPQPPVESPNKPLE